MITETQDRARDIRLEVEKLEKLGWVTSEHVGYLLYLVSLLEAPSSEAAKEE